MPYSTFQPVIGSGFDADAAQQFQWTQLNANTDAQNIARAQRAQAEYNNYLRDTALMGRDNQIQQNQWAQSDFQVAQSRQSQAQRDAEAKRQFDVGVQAQREAQDKSIQAQKAQFDQQLELTKAEEQKANTFADRFGTHFAPQAQSAVADYHKLSKQYAQAENELLTAGREEELKLKNPQVRYDPKTYSLVPTMAHGILPPEAAAANERLSQKVAAYSGLKEAYAAAAKRLQDAHSTAAGAGWMVNPDGTLYNPKLDKQVGEPIDERDFEIPAPTAAPAAPVVAPVAPPAQPGLLSKVAPWAAGAASAITPGGGLPILAAQRMFQPATTTGTTPAPEKVRIILPNGKIGTVPADKVDEAIRVYGAKLAPANG